MTDNDLRVPIIPPAPSFLDPDNADEQERWLEYCSLAAARFGEVSYRQVGEIGVLIAVQRVGRLLSSHGFMDDPAYVVLRDVCRDVICSTLDRIE